MRRKFLSPALGVAIAALLATTTGYCAFGTREPPVTVQPSPVPAPVPVIPEAIVPFDLLPQASPD